MMIKDSYSILKNGEDLQVFFDFEAMINDFLLFYIHSG